MKKNIIWTIFCLLSSTLSLVVILNYPVGDWVSSSLISEFILIPIIIIQLIISLFLYQYFKSKLLLGFNIAFSIVSILIMIYYIKVH